MTNKYTIFFEQVNRTNFQVKANSENEALEKAIRLYKRNRELPEAYVQDDWIVNSDGEDK